MFHAFELMGEIEDVARHAARIGQVVRTGEQYAHGLTRFSLALQSTNHPSPWVQVPRLAPFWPRSAVPTSLGPAVALGSLCNVTERQGMVNSLQAGLYG